MSAAQYRVWIDRQPADRALYDRLETVTVEQAMGMATEARLEFESCMDGRGIWKKGPSDPIARAWRRVRVEVKHGGGAWTPLIDGPIVAWNASMSGEAGRSMLTVTVHDDSALLDKMKLRPDIKWENKTPKQVAQTLLEGYDAVIDEIVPAPSDRPEQFMVIGTPMQVLLSLTRAFGVFVYVKPGETVDDRSRAFVKKIEVDKPPAFPPLILVGPKRNIDSFDTRSDALFNNRFAASRLNLSDMSVVTFTSSWKDVDLLADEPLLDDPEDLGFDMTDPVDAQAYDLMALGTANQQRVSFTLTGSGTVRTGCYSGVLEPYETILVGGVDAKTATKYTIRDVTHSLGRSTYEQSFTLMGNAVFKLDENGHPVPTEPAGIGMRG